MPPDLTPPHRAPADAGLPPLSGTVFLLHGLNRTQLSMARLAVGLRRRGLRVVNRYYHTRTHTLEEHADAFLRRLRAAHGPEHGPFHFVGHSLGCIVVRCALFRCAPDALPRSQPGRFVMIAPPNQGSELARVLSGWRFGATLFGHGAFGQLAHPELLAAWGSPPLTFGVIAGGRGDGHGWNPLLPGDDDGVVTVAGTHLAGEADHLVLPSLHTTLPWRRDTLRHCAHFLATGRFATIPADRGRA